MRSYLLASLVAAASLAPAYAADVSLTTSDGVTLHAETWGSGANGVVLVHAAGRSVEDWSYFGERLGQKGFNVIAVDLRGHGGSTTPATLAADDYPKMVNDVAAGVAWLRAHGATQVHLIGAGLGANLAIHDAVADTQIADLALLSAGMNLNGVASPTQFEQYGNRPALVVAAEGDDYGARSATVLERKAQGRFYLEMLSGDASGTVLINRDPQLEGKLVAWLNGTYDSEGQMSGRQVNTDQGGDIETSGRRFGDEP